MRSRFVIYWCSEAGSPTWYVCVCGRDRHCQWPKRYSVLLDVIGLRGSHVNSRLATHVAVVCSCRIRTAIVVEAFANNLLNRRSLSAIASKKASFLRESTTQAHQLTFEEFHEAFGETKASCHGDRRGGDGHSCAACCGNRARTHASVRAYSVVKAVDSFIAQAPQIVQRFVIHWSSSSSPFLIILS